ncbi:MAG TPA: PilZ domain-containing protein [Polyangia bacterium]
MYDILSPHPDNRRLSPRLRLQVVLNEYVWDRPYRALAMDVSEAGVAIQKVTEAAVPFAKMVALEVVLPGTNETIWASAEPMFDDVGRNVHVSGLRFVSMARKHERLIRDYLRERRERLLRLFYPASRPLSRFA